MFPYWSQWSTTSSLLVPDEHKQPTTDQSPRAKSQAVLRSHTSSSASTCPLKTEKIFPGATLLFLLRDSLAI